MATLRERLAVGAILGALLVGLLVSSSRTGVTYDELANIPSAIARAHFGEESDYTHPPLARDLASIPLFLHGIDPVDTPDAAAEVARGDWKAYGRRLIFHNPSMSAGAIVFWSRVPNMLLTLLGGGLVWGWSRRRYGAAGGLLSLGAYALAPPLLAHGGLCTTDLPVAVAFLLAALVLERSLRAPGRRNHALVGVAIGVAFLTKFSALALVPVSVLLWILAWLRERALGRPRTFVAAVLRPALLAAAVGAATLWAGYGFQVRRPIDDVAVSLPVGHQIIARIDRALGARVEELLDVPIPAWDFWKGIGAQVVHTLDQSGWTHEECQYLWGRFDPDGWWWYFPLAFAWKTPLPLLAGFALAIAASGIALGSRLRRRGLARVLARADVGSFALVVPPLVYAGFCVCSTIDIGHRFLLPLYPFLFVALGGLARLAWLRSKRARVAGIALASWLAVGTSASLGDPLAYFNETVGGTAHGWRYLVDSNVDWGQDLGRLRGRLRAAGIHRFFLDVHHSARPVEDLHLWGAQPIPDASWDDRPPAIDGLVVVSATRLLSKDARAPRPRYWWLLDEKPFARVGASLFAYWVASGRVTAPPAGLTL